MVTKVKATENFWLLDKADHFINRAALDALINFSISKLRELKLVTANFKNGFDFRDPSCLRYDLRKFYKLLITSLNKVVPFLPDNCLYNFVGITSSGSPIFFIQCEKDMSVRRYILRLSRKLDLLDLPFEVVADNGASNTFIIKLYCTASFREASLECYKLIFLSPDLITILKTLSRKASFSNEQFRLLNRSGLTGFTAKVKT